jgi:hypothetical protein
MKKKLGVFRDLNYRFNEIRKNLKENKTLFNETPEYYNDKLNSK